MEDRHITLDIIRRLGFSTIEDLWCFKKFYDAIDYEVLLKELHATKFGHTNTAMTMLVHASPILLALEKTARGPTKQR